MYYHHDNYAHGSLVPLHLDCILKKKEIGTHEKGGDIYFTTTQKKGRIWVMMVMVVVMIDGKNDS